MPTKAWRDLPDNELKEKDVYVGAYGWTDNDAVAVVWARNAHEFRARISKEIRNEAKEAISAGEVPATIASKLTQMWFTGPDLESIEKVLELYVEDKSRTGEQLNDFRTLRCGVLY